MASFAKIGLNNKIIEILSVHDNVLLDSNGTSHESLGISFLTNLTGWAIWKQSFTDGTRKNSAAIGYIYDEDRDAFILKKPFASWILNEETCIWEAPSTHPNTQTQNLTDQEDNPINDRYEWNESTTTWDIVE